MSKGWKIALSIAAAVLLLMMLGVGGCIYYFSQLGKNVEQDKVAGERFGETADENACLKEGLARAKGKNMITGTAAGTAFLIGCLEKSKPSPGFCTDVPSRQDKEGSRTWAEAKCRELGQNDITCGAMLGMVIAHCQKNGDRTDATPEPTKEEKKK
ncbi:MAG TPA: hypothetical protein PLD20_15475 [Blastocatellia bacterium]|nr:hypothetical protein [Blastocatellia bacterium]HMX29825.1 hypothetical protein [Blastocatellia bacterium]HMY73903.1 hypothetical protein [Blastocatellia bacterium]HMZ19336.1 hypothetical protein [Blastocatellia bacterium]HNG31316.1 hypothetical protein [Blastocatellia bacterium]